MAASRHTPPLSVVLAARDAAGPLRLRLEGLCRQTLPRDQFEVIVVDDGSTDGTLDVARAFGGDLPLRTSRQRAAGISAARNHGVFCARGLVVLFLEEGVPEPELLAAHLEAHRRYPDRRFAVVGDARPSAELAGDPLLRFLAEAVDLDFARGAPPGGEVRGFAHLHAARASLKRGLLLERGVFHPAFRHCGGDLDLALRLAPHGLAVVHAPAAAARLVEAPALDQVCARLEHAGAAAVLLERRHDTPEARALARAGGAAARWAELAPLHPVVLRSAHGLDRFVRQRLGEGLEVDEHDLSLLHRSYEAVLEASRLRGAARAERELAPPAGRRAGAASGL